jgi:hypothetical protein
MHRYVVFTRMLEYLYTGSVSDMSRDTVRDDGSEEECDQEGGQLTQRLQNVQMMVELLQVMRSSATIFQCAAPPPSFTFAHSPPLPVVWLITILSHHCPHMLYPRRLQISSC